MRPRLPLVAAVTLVAAFICPLVIGHSWLFGPTLLAHAPPGLRMVALVPGIAGPIALLAALALRGLPRAVALLLVGGVALVALVAHLEALTRGQAALIELTFTRGATPAPDPATAFGWSLALTAAFTGLALARRADPTLGLRLTGLAGAALLALTLAPLGARPAIAFALDPVAWATAWPAPLTALAGGVFGALCAASLLDLAPPVVTRLAWIAGALAVAALPLGMSLDTAARHPDLLASTVTLMVKLAGTWIALHALLAAGALEMLAAPPGAGGGSRAAR